MMMTTTSARLLLIAAASSSLAVFPVGADAARTTRDRIRPNKEIGILSYPGEISHVFQAAEVAREVARRGADVTFGVWEHDMDALLSTIEAAEERDEGPRGQDRLRVCVEYEEGVCIPSQRENAAVPEAEDCGIVTVVPFKLFKNYRRDGVELLEEGAESDGVEGRGESAMTRMSREDKIALSKTVWNSGNDDDEVNRYAKDQLKMCPQILHNRRIAEVFTRADMLVLDGYFICNVLASFLHRRRYVAIRSFSAWPKGGCCEPWPQPYVSGIGSSMVESEIGIFTAASNLLRSSITKFGLPFPTEVILLGCQVLDEAGAYHEQAVLELWAQNKLSWLRKLSACVSTCKYAVASPIMNLYFTSLETPRSIYSNTYYTGSVLVKPAMPITDARLLRLIEEAGNDSSGFIIISLGTMDWLDFKSMLKIRDAVEALAPMRAIWKASMVSENQKQALERSGNIVVTDWIPQNDLLGHKICLCFLTHCGRNSVEEAAYHGVPIVGLPRSQEQLLNLRLAKQHGFGIGPLNQFHLDADTLVKAVEDSIEGDVMDAAIAISRLVRAHPKPPIERAGDLIEFAWNLDDESISTSAFTAPPRSITMSNAEAIAPYVLVVLFAAVLLAAALVLPVVGTYAIWASVRHLRRLRLGQYVTSHHVLKGVLKGVFTDVFAFNGMLQRDATVIISSKTARRRKQLNMDTPASAYDMYPLSGNVEDRNRSE